MSTKNKRTLSKKYIILIAIIAVILIAVLSIFVGASASKLNNQTFYEGTRIGKVNVSGMNIDEAKAAVTAQYQGELSGSITITCQEHEKQVSLPELSAALDEKASVELAYAVGRTGNAFSRLREISKIKDEGYTVPPVIQCDETALNAAISELASLVDIPEQDLQVAVIEDEMVITRGKPGKRILLDKAMTRFKNEVLSLTDDVLTLELEDIIPPEPNAETLYEEYCGEPVDASYVIENQRLTVTESKDGIAFNKQEAKKIITETVGDVIKIPVVVTPAKVTAEEVKNSLFPDMLSRYSTNYNAGDTSRSHNVQLASEKINEVVLAPGDVFSYNDTVGPRTTERGFRTANVYVGNKVEPGIGGGICQVSSTLFNAVVLADLNIVYRTNHSLPVSYVPLGRDATVSYGSIDFKFSNNTGEPVKITASASGGKNTIAIYGVKANKNRTIEITTQHTGTIPSKLVQKENPELPQGTIEVEQKGSNGSYYNTYKITKENGNVVKNELLTKSTYVATDRIEIIGTAPTASALPGDPSVPVDATAPTTEGTVQTPPADAAEATAAPDTTPATPATAPAAPETPVATDAPAA